MPKVCQKVPGGVPLVTGGVNQYPHSSQQTVRAFLNFEKRESIISIGRRRGAASATGPSAALSASGPSTASSATSSSASLLASGRSGALSATGRVVVSEDEQAIGCI